jgi:cellulose synthase/poly-beta-1,6-N-acetylglucosamine synthase-like glycosyltransferase
MHPLPAVLLCGLLLQLSYHVFIFSRLAFHKSLTPQGLSNDPVSVIICARNEYENLKQFLPNILMQKYPAYEVIVVNDRSTDASAELLAQLSTQFTHLRMVSITDNIEHGMGKKMALKAGIEAAKHDWILCTDADCSPKANLWLQGMMAARADKDMVLGYAPLKVGNGLLGLMIERETLFTAIQYFSYAICGMAYMGVGRNILYKKSLFQRYFPKVESAKLASGDDDLLVSAVKDKDKIGVCYDPETYMYSAAPHDWSTWVRQKTRHLSSGRSYGLSTLLLLGIYPISLLLFYAAMLACCMHGDLSFFSVLAIWLGYLTMSMFIKYKAASKLGVTAISCIIGLDSLYLTYQAILIPLSLIRNKNIWK